MKQVYLPDGSSMPQLGQGTWQMGEDDNKYEREIAGLRHGVELGMNLIDTAEMYADGKAENIAGNAAKAFARKSLYICDKVYPQNANKQHIYSSAERSLKLLGTDYIDLYLLHWREDADLAEVVYCMEDLKDRGWIRRWGVSNFDVDDMEDLWKVPDGSTPHQPDPIQSGDTRHRIRSACVAAGEKRPVYGLQPGGTGRCTDDSGRGIKSHADGG